MSQSPIAISVQGVSKKFKLGGDRPSSIKELLISRTRSAGRDFWALDNVSLDIPKGAFFGLIGHNGSGKSTLLRLMAGIHRPNGGTISVDGRISALLELGSGFHPDLTGRENIYLNGTILGVPREDMERSVDKIIEFSGLEDFIDTPIKAYSSGMYVRLGFAVAVNVDPEILLVDEVIAVGDEDFQRRCLDHMYELRRKGVTIVFVSHGIGMVESLCDEVGWMDHGHLEKLGEPAAVCQAYIAHVNDIEAERHEDEAEEEDAPELVPVQEGESRRGSGEIRVTGVDLRNYVTDESLEVAGTGDTVAIRLWYRSTTTVENPLFDIDIYHESGTYITGPSTGTTGDPIESIPPGEGHVDFYFSKLPILSGNFYVSTSIFDADHLHCFDSWSHARKLIVQPGQGRERNGLVDSTGHFAVHVHLG